MPNNRERKRFAFAPTFRVAREIVLDKDLAKLGDAYTNFAYSLFMSERGGKPAGGKVSSHVLSEAFRRAGLRSLLHPAIELTLGPGLPDCPGYEVLVAGLPKEKELDATSDLRVLEDVIAFLRSKQ